MQIHARLTAIFIVVFPNFFLNSTFFSSGGTNAHVNYMMFLVPWQLTLICSVCLFVFFLEPFEFKPLESFGQPFSG